MIGIPNNSGVMDIDFFTRFHQGNKLFLIFIGIEQDTVEVVNEEDLPFVILKQKMKRFKMRKRDRNR